MPHDSLAVEALAAQLRCGCMQHLLAGSGSGRLRVSAGHHANEDEVLVGQPFESSAALFGPCTEWTWSTSICKSHLLCARLRLVPDHRWYAGPHDARLRARYGFQAAACLAGAQHQLIMQGRAYCRYRPCPG